VKVSCKKKPEEMSTRWDEAGAAGEKAVAKAGSRKTERVDWSFILVVLHSISLLNN
jgi:hypothetical protein